LKAEKDQMEHLLESDGEKRSAYEVEGRCKILQDKNKTLLSEVIALRKELDQKDYEVEKALTKASQLEKKMVLMQRQVQQQQVINQMPLLSQMVMPFQTSTGQVQFGAIADYA
jgi:hypothetical protein